MPLAMVLGQPFLQMPQDLYIPPDALEVILEAFEGPLASAVVTEGGAFELAFADEPLADRRLQFRFFSGLELLASVEHEVNGGTVRFEHQARVVLRLFRFNVCLRQLMDALITQFILGHHRF